MNRTEKFPGRSGTIPTGVTNCVWMDAGIVAYKLCDRSYDCEHCSFDEALHGQRSELADRLESFQTHGCQVARDLFYHPHHTWMRIEENGAVRIGLDDFGQRLLGTTYALALPPRDTTITRGESCCHLALQSEVVTLLSPVSGKVRNTNSDLRLRPSLVNRDPYGSGWMILVEPTDLKACLKRSLYGQKVELWLTAEIKKLHSLINNLTMNEHFLPVTMNDGGLLSHELLQELTVEQARRVISSFFPLATSEAEHTSAIVFPDGR